MDEKERMKVQGATSHRDTLDFINKQSRLIRKIIKQKVNAYYQGLDFKRAYNGFLAYLQGEDSPLAMEKGSDILQMDKNMTGTFMENLVRPFLVEKNYRYLIYENHDHVTGIIIDICNKFGIPRHCAPDIEDFVREKLEKKEKLAKVAASFKERSKFTSYFYSIVMNLLKEYQAKYYVEGVQQEELEESKEKAFQNAVAPGAKPHTQAELKEIMERVEKLDAKEKLAFKMYYLENKTNISAIAKTLKMSHYKTKIILAQALEKVTQGGV